MIKRRDDNIDVDCCNEEHVQTMGVENFDNSFSPPPPSTTVYFILPLSLSLQSYIAKLIRQRKFRTDEICGCARKNNSVQSKSFFEALRERVSKLLKIRSLFRSYIITLFQSRFISFRKPHKQKPIPSCFSANKRKGWLVSVCFSYNKIALAKSYSFVRSFISSIQVIVFSIQNFLSLSNIYLTSTIEYYTFYAGR